MLHSPGIDALFALQDRPIGSYQPIVYADVLSQGKVIATQVPLTGAPVQSSRTQFARRTATVTVVDPALVPQGGLSDVLRLGNELRIHRGIGFPLQSPEVLPQITGAITSAEVTYENGSPTGAEVQIADRARALSRARFLAPRVLPAGSARQMLESLILEVAPWWTLRFVGDVEDAQVVRQTFDRERDDAVATLATAIGCEVFSDGYGEFVVQPIPDVDGAPVLQIRGGEGGNLITGARSISDDGVYNAVVASGQTSVNGSPPHSDPVLDLDPTSVTRWGGPFLQVPAFFDSPLITTTTQATIAARAQLRNVVGAARSVTFSLIPHPGLEVGDLVGVTFPDGSYEQHLIDTLSMPLTPTDPITASTRASRSAGLS